MPILTPIHFVAYLFHLIISLNTVSKQWRYIFPQMFTLYLYDINDKRTDYKTNLQIAKKFKNNSNFGLEYKRNWIQHVNRMPCNRLPRIMKHYSRTGRRNHGRPLKRLLDTWDRNGSTSGPTPWKIDDDDDDEQNTSPSVQV
jgi:hypothetical protein